MKEPKKLMVAVVSSQNRFCDIEGNLKRFEGFVRRAVRRGARLVCFPELALTSYTLYPSIVDFSQCVPGPATNALAEMAARYKVYLSVGMPEKEGAKHYITQVIVGPNGYLGKYRKHHPTTGEREAGFSAGTGFPVFAIDDFTLGINICFDGRHQDTIEAMKKRRVDVVHHPHGNELGLGKNAEEWTRGKMTYLVSRAIYARAYLLVNNSAGETKGPGGVMRFGSGAMAIDPLGQVVSRTVQGTQSEKMLVTALFKPLSAFIPSFEKLGRYGKADVVGKDEIRGE